MSGASASATMALLVEIGFTHVVCIPDGESRHLYEEACREERVEVVLPTREGEGIAIAAGLAVGGARPLVLLQNTGLMEAGDALRGCGIGPSIPFLLMVGWRGYAGAVAGKEPVDSAYPYTEPLLRAWGLPYRKLISDQDLTAVSEMAEVTRVTSKPAAVLFGYPFRP